MTRLILAEDDVALRAILQKTLSIEGYAVTAVGDGIAALEELEREEAKILLTDINMPRMNGLELCRRLRENAQFAQLGIVVLTATTAQDNLFEILQRGADAWIAKPYSREHLVASLRAVDERRRFISQQYILGDWLEFSLASSLDVVHSVNELIALLLNQSPLAAEEIQQLGFAISELLLNAMEHGNRFRSDLRVRCSYVLFSDRLVLKIEDQGSGFVPALVPDPTNDPLGVALARSAAGKRPGGYGLAMAKKFAEISYSDNGNLVLLTKHFS